MAGMLPGVECARRRRFHQGGGLSDTSWSASPTRTSRRPSFSLRSESNYNYISSLQRMSMKEQENEKLGGAAREAKQRLDEKLVRRHRKSEAKSHSDHQPPTPPTSLISDRRPPFRPLQRSILKPDPTAANFSNLPSLRHHKSPPATPDPKAAVVRRWSCWR